MLIQCLERLRMIKIENNVDLIEKVKGSFPIPGELILQRYLNAWAEWVDISPPEIQHVIKTKVDFCKFEHREGHLSAQTETAAT